MNRRQTLAWLPLAFLLLLPSAAGASGPAAHYVPRTGDRFAYAETILVTNGQGNYTGYTEEGYYNGSITIGGVPPNGTANASYQASGLYENSQGAHRPWSESGTFSFSSATFLYVRGTDNETGYVNPTVWFYIDGTLAQGATFELLNTPMQVVSRSDPFPSATSPTGYVATIFAEGSGSYQRNDTYGNFTANYTWKAYFDPATGYIVGYAVSERDSDARGDGFTYTDTLSDTQTTFPLSPAAAPASSNPFPWVLVIAAVLGAVLVGVIAYELARRRGRAARLPQHPATAVPEAMPPYAPPPVHLIPGDQPRIQQVVIRETVKVPCRFCGTLIDSTATNCPNCGAPRS